jgi:alkylhydroperoxidase family enzyme
MSTASPRIRPLPQAEWDSETREIFKDLPSDGRVFNIFSTLARYPKLLKRWLVFGTHILMKSSLPPRDREMVILRVGWLCRAEYEWAHHVVIGKQAGLSAEDIQRVAAGPEAPGWDGFEAVLLRAVDELNGDCRISDSTWKALAARYNTQQMLDLIFTAGQYRMVSMALNSVGVELEEGFEGFSHAAQG